MFEESAQSEDEPTGDGDSRAGRSSDGVRDVPSRDARTGVLADRRRRYVLSRLEASGAPMAVADLADDVVRRETDRSPTAMQDERERIYVSLYHNHLPKLAAAELVRFDADRKLVELAADVGELPLDVPK
ncbi:DUF7344 domain-containing protein [Halorussus sp. AFM4]|uniref:DUF7344 domain-containing protein n=1 Tax=Halorussus sp. AFM4 TaxID=3421651 RepID=UPI003EB778F8